MTSETVSVEGRGLGSMKVHCTLKLASLIVCCVALFYMSGSSGYYSDMFPQMPSFTKAVIQWRSLLLLVPIPWAFVLLGFRRKNSFEAAPTYSASITLAMVVLTFTVVVALFYVPFHKLTEQIGEPEVENVSEPGIEKPEKSSKP
jgi:hypothetical protein